MCLVRCVNHRVVKSTQNLILNVLVDLAVGLRRERCSLIKKIIHIISVGLLLFSLILSGFCVMRIWKLERANKDFESKIETLTNKVDAVDNQNFSLKKRASNLENDLDTLIADFEDHWHY